MASFSYRLSVFLSAMRRHQLRSIVLRYGAAIAAVCVTLAIKLLLIPIVSRDEPFVLFFAAVVVSAWIGGFGPGLFATALATVCNFYFFMPPFNEFGLLGADAAALLALSVVEGICLSFICTKFREARDRAEHAAREARELERQILEISDAEQRRIGHDLHDGLGQHLTGIALLSRHLENRLSSEQSSQISEATKIAELAAAAVEWTHDLCRTLSPPALERSGLVEALRELSANAEVVFGVRCNFEAAPYNAEFRDVGVGVHLYRIAQEAISNAVKHGKAKNIRLRLQLAPAELILFVRDDGLGISHAQSPEPNPQSNGMGLRIMQYRAKMIGASIGINQPPDEGTTVTCRYALHTSPPQHTLGAAHG
jgi:signal transduction histidine kinase